MEEREYDFDDHHRIWQGRSILLSAIAKLEKCENLSDVVAESLDKVRIINDNLAEIENRFNNHPDRSRKYTSRRIRHEGRTPTDIKRLHRGIELLSNSAFELGLLGKTKGYTGTLAKDIPVIKEKIMKVIDTLEKEYLMLSKRKSM
ncbi:MAG: hypothetical protein ISN28_11315 [Ectothiorhodospiraceae bacterium AqS1]|nr:hypothetical protein [Ectothiorhodospiraceae bacterium AqS1]